MTEFTLGNEIPFPKAPHARATTIAVGGNTREPFTINGAETSTEAHIRRMFQYQITAGTGCSNIIDVYSINMNGCTVDDECAANYHSMLLAVVSTLNADGYPLSHIIVDFPLLCLHGSLASNLPRIGAMDPGFITDYQINTALSLAASRVMASFHFPSDTYAATVYEAAIGITVNGDGGATLEVPAPKRMIHRGESLNIKFDQRGNWDILHIPAVIDATEPTVEAEPETLDGTAALSLAQQDLINSLRAEITMLTERIAQRDATIAHAQQTCINYTRSNDGCNDGKYGFLNATNLWPDYGRVELLELIGIEERQDYNIRFTVQVPVSYTVELDPAQVEDFSASDLEDYIDGSILDDITTQAIRYETVEIVSVDDITED